MDLRSSVHRAIEGVEVGSRVTLTRHGRRAAEVCAALRATGHLWHFDEASDTPDGARVVATRILPAEPGKPRLVGVVGSNWPESRNA